MQLDKLKKYINEYVAWLEKTRAHPRLYLWETQAHFQSHWNTDTSDLVQMYYDAIENSVTRRYWQEDLWYPKKMMMELLKMEPMSGRLMFADLFDETKNPQNRMDRCIFFCDTLLAEYRKRHPLTKENDHFHSDYRMISFYMALRYPDTYVPYRFELMQCTLRNLASMDVPEHHDCERFYKVCKTLYAFLEKDGRALSLLASKLDKRKHYTTKTLLLAYDLCCFIHEQK